MQQVNLDRERMETEHARQRAEQQSEIEKLKLQIGASEEQTSKMRQQNLLTVRESIRRRDHFHGPTNRRQRGSAGQVLCQLAPKDAKPRARMTLNEAGLPKLAVAQRVRYFFEAYPYQRYGAVTGKLDWISPSAVHYQRWLALRRAGLTRPR